MRAIWVLALPLFALPASANTKDCGENAFTYAEVIEAKPGEVRRGPIMSLPDSLCAELVEDRKPAIGSLNLQIGGPYGGSLPWDRRTTGRGVPSR